jgi:hypothetical protein
MNEFDLREMLFACEAYLKEQKRPWLERDPQVQEHYDNVCSPLAIKRLIHDFLPKVTEVRAD